MRTVSNSRALAICLAVVWAASAPRLAWGQWTGGPTGPIYYNGGNVGIGTTNPPQKLSVFGATSTEDVRIDAEVPNSGAPSVGRAALSLRAPWGGDLYLVAQGGIASTFWGIPGNTGGLSSPWRDLVFATDGAGTGYERMRISATGNVGIGTTNPQYRLSVNGQIGAKDVIVTNSGWSDYVFRPGYRLRPLSEVDAYIQANHHLPDIPSAAEVQEKGVSIGDMQSKLLAKIEELTLHMIQQDKENRNLRERIAQLEAHAAGNGGPAAGQ